MDPQYLQELLEKYQAGRCTAQELDELEAWYASLGGDRPNSLLEPGSEAALELTQRKLSALKESVASGKRAPLWRSTLRWAAVFAGLIILAGGIYLVQQRRQGPGLPQIVPQLGYNRYITLPDSSTVVLHAGSRLDYPAAFSGPVREVTLSGEAFFDIRGNSRQSFVIRTGRLKTTVLGTAFNIKAYPGAEEITVSVTHGKVKVEDDKKVLAVLMPHQQIVYNTAAATAAQQPLNAAAQLSWTHQDMIFENLSFEEVAALLSKRYEVNILFRNEALKQCPVRASFKGTEPLSYVLDVVCGVRNATYTTGRDHEIIIDGKGCYLEQ